MSILNEYTNRKCDYLIVTPLENYCLQLDELQLIREDVSSFHLCF